MLCYISYVLLSFRICKYIFTNAKGQQKDWCWCWNANTLATWCKELTHWKRPWCWARLKEGGEGDDRGWDGWMASRTQRTWVWVDSGSWWWTGSSGLLQSTGLQRVGHGWATEFNCTELISEERTVMRELDQLSKSSHFPNHLLDTNINWLNSSLYSSIH